MAIKSDYYTVDFQVFQVFKFFFRNISRDGQFVVGSEATSTGYVSDSVDGYDKYKGLESEHGGSNKSTREGEYDSSISYDKKFEVVKPEICLESSVTKSLSPKLNLNIKYDDEVEEKSIEVEPEIEKAEPEIEEPIKSLVYVEDSETDDESSEDFSTNTNSGTNSGSNSGHGTSIEYSISHRSDSGRIKNHFRRALI